MATTPFSKLAYKTLQQGKGIAGLAHKELSTKLMELLAPRRRSQHREHSSGSAEGPAQLHGSAGGTRLG